VPNPSPAQSTKRAIATPEVSVIIPTYQRADRLSGIIQALSEQTTARTRFEVIIIDDCSNDDTWATLTRLSADVPFALRILQTSVNQGPASARNLGWQAARAPIAAFLDDDCLPESEWLEAGLSVMQNDERLGVLQGRVRPHADFEPIGMGTWYHCQIIDTPTPYFEACNIFYRVQALMDGRGFDEDLSWWCEDTALGWRVVEAGWARGYAAGAAVVHEVQQRGWKWYARNGWRETHTVQMAALHPEFRREAFWRPWAYRPEDAGFVLSIVGVILGFRFRPTLLLALPYIWLRWPTIGRLNPVRQLMETLAVDAARSGGQLRGAFKYRIPLI
jgi:glycosyltransferase involved in cell wall biosynthesis